MDSQDVLSRHGIGKKGEGFPEGWNEEVENVALENLVEGDPILSFDNVSNWDTSFTKLNTPKSSHRPTSHGNGATFSSDSNYLAIAHQTSPCITIYKRSGDTFTKLTNPSVLPPYMGYNAIFSPNGTYLAVTCGDPYITIYKQEGDTFTKLDNPSILPTREGDGIAFSPDSNYLAIAHQTSPFVTIYKRNGDTFTKLDNPSILPTAKGNGAAFSPDGNYLAITHEASPFVTIYKRNGDTFTKLDNPLTGISSEGTGVGFSLDGSYLGIGSSYGASIAIYKRNGDTFTKLVDPSPTVTAMDIAFSPDGTYWAVGGSPSYIAIFKRNGDSFTKIEDPASLPPNPAAGVAVSPDGAYLAAAHTSSPYVTIYKTTVLSGLKKITEKVQFNELALNTKIGVAAENIAKNATGKVTLFPRINNLP